MSDHLIHLRITQLRNKLATADIKKSGHNEFSGFRYYELKDFLPYLNKFCEELNISHTLQIHPDKASIIFYNCENQTDNTEISIMVPPVLLQEIFAQRFVDRAGKQKEPNFPQLYGSILTYIKRYAYIMALDLCEGDNIELNIGNGSSTPAAQKDSQTSLSEFQRIKAAFENTKSLAEIEHVQLSEFENITRLNQSEKNDLRQLVYNQKIKFGPNL
jgi:hypothetical protein